MFLVILASIAFIEFIHFLLGVPDLDNIPGLYEGIHRIRQSSYQKVKLEILHHLPVKRFAHRNLLFKAFPGVADELIPDIVSPKEFLEIQLIHLNDLDGSTRLGQGLVQRYSQLGAADNVGETVILL